MRLVAIAVALLLTIAAAQPMAGVYPVGPGGSGIDSFATVQQAASALSARGMAGNIEFPISQFVYVGPVTVRNVAGSSLFRTRFYASGIGAIVDAGRAGHAFAVESTDNVTIQGLRFRGCRDSGSAFVRLTASDDCTLRSCRLEDSAQFGVQVLHSDRFAAESLRLEGDLLGPASRGLDFQDCRYAFATRCTMSGRVGTGLWIQGGSDNGNYRVSVPFALNHGLHVESSPRVSIHNFRARGSSEYACYMVNSPNARLDSCVFADAVRAQALFESCESLWFDMSMAIGDAEKAVAVINSRFSTVRALSVMGSPGRGLFVSGSPGCHVDSTQYAGFQADTCIGIEVDSSDEVLFLHTQVTGRVARGISIRRSDDVKFSRTRMNLTAAEAGLYLEQADRVRLEPCSLRLTGPARAAVLVADSSVADSFLRMTIVGSPRVGILARGAQDLVVANSFIRGWTVDGIRLEATRSPSIFYNTVVGSASGSGAAVSVQDATDLQACDNILATCGNDSSACWVIIGAWPMRSGGSNYNDLYVARPGNIGRINDTLYSTLTEWQGLPWTPDLASIAADPGFASDSDYHITANSPCRDAGTSLPGFGYDLDADQRDTISPDIGADEFRAPGVEENHGTVTARPQPEPAIVRGGMKISDVVSGRACLELLDICGRTVKASRQSANDLIQLPPGIYFIRSPGNGTSGPWVRKVVILR